MTAEDTEVAVRVSERPEERATPPGPARRRRRRHRGRRDPAVLAVADVAAAAPAAAGVAAVIGMQPLLLLGPVLCGALALNARAGLYRSGLETYALDELPALARRIGVVWCGIAALLAALDRTFALGWVVLLAAVGAHTALTGAARALVHGARRFEARRRPRPALIVGSGRPARRIAGVFAEHPRYGLRPVGIVDVFGETHLVEADGEDPALPVLVAFEDAKRAVIQNTVRDAVFLDSPWSDPRHVVLARELASRGVTGWLVRPGCATGGHGTHRPHGGHGRHRVGGAHVWGYACSRLPLECPGAGWTLRKRLLDVALVLPALVVAAPVLAGCALAVRLSDGPGVIFRQERVGLGGVPFTLLKFRTLKPANEKESATRWNVADDARMSRVGRLLRRTSLDELPQLWNVLRGDMSLVGPRPERPYFVQKFSRKLPGYAERHRSPVGITGLAQVYGLRGDTSIEERARFDNHYIETWSLWQDVRIMLRTAASFFRLEGR